VNIMTLVLPNQDAAIDQLLAEIEFDALTLASVALATERAARFGDDVQALRSSINIARITTLEMIRAFNKIEAHTMLMGGAK
jgi:hypothetical protein